jgi:hypothetical protein
MSACRIVGTEALGFIGAADWEVPLLAAKHPQDFELLSLVPVHGGDSSMTAQSIARLIPTQSW